jgi:hypothetical protein
MLLKPSMQHGVGLSNEERTVTARKSMYVSTQQGFQYVQTFICLHVVLIRWGWIPEQKTTYIVYH